MHIKKNVMGEAAPAPKSSFTTFSMALRAMWLNNLLILIPSIRK